MNETIGNAVQEVLRGEKEPQAALDAAAAATLSGVNATWPEPKTSFTAYRTLVPMSP